MLKSSGTVWINLGDTYGGNKTGNDDPYQHEKGNRIKKNSSFNKSLLLIPHRFAIGCMERGWIIRNDIIWAKRNGMPEPVTDRFSKKHEYVFLMTKEEKYFFDLDAIRDKHSTATIKRFESGWDGNEDRDYVEGRQNNMSKFMNNPEAKAKAIEMGKNPGDVADFWDVTLKGSSKNHNAQYNDGLLIKPVLAGCPENGIIYDPFMGSGTTALVAIRANRKFIGSEMSEVYFKDSQIDIDNALSQHKLF